MPYRYCEKEYRKRFSVRTETCMEASNLGFQIWAIAIYLMTTSLKGVFSMKLHRNLDKTQKSAWHLSMRLHKALDNDGVNLQFTGPVEADETYVGGLEKNKHHERKLKAGDVGKAIVIGVKDCGTNKVAAKVIPDTKEKTLQAFVEDHSEPQEQVYTDEGIGYKGIRRDHESVNHSAGEYVRDMAHTKGIESFWAMLERSHKGTFYKFSKKHLQRYMNEFSGRYNVRCADTVYQMESVVAGTKGYLLRYKYLIVDNGLSSGARY